MLVTAQQAFNAQLVEEAKARRQQKIDADLAKEMAKKMTPPSKAAQTPSRRGSVPTPTFSPISNPDEEMPGTSNVTVWTDDMEEEDKIYEVADPDKPVNVGEAVVADLHLLEQEDDDETATEAGEQEPEDMDLGEEEAPATHFHIEGEAVVADPTTGQMVPPTPAQVSPAPAPAQATTPIPPPLPPAPTTAPLAQAIAKAKKKRAEARAAEEKPTEEKTAEAKPAPDKESEAEGVGKQPSPQKAKTFYGKKDE